MTESVAPSGYAINGKPVKDMDDGELAKAAEFTGAQTQAIFQQLQTCVARLQMFSSMQNIVQYEIERRKVSLTVVGADVLRPLARLNGAR
jgi:hypothetical protein